MGDNDLAGLLAIVSLFIGLPWIILNHVTKWKTAATLTHGDEAMLEELYQLGRRLNDRMDTVERLVAADHPDFRTAVAEQTPRFDDPLTGPSSLDAYRERTRK